MLAFAESADIRDAEVFEVRKRSWRKLELRGMCCGVRMDWIEWWSWISCSRVPKVVVPRGSHQFDYVLFVNCSCDG